MKNLFFIVVLCSAIFGQSATATGASKTMNPAISANGLFIGRYFEPALPVYNGFILQEMEFQFSSVVDPYFQADITMALHPPHSHDDEDEHETHGMTVDIEEGYLKTFFMPRGFGFRFGKFLLPFGKHNPLHTHMYPFTHAPSSVENIFGDHAAADVGGELSYSLPLPWYSEVIFTATDGNYEHLFDAGSSDLAFGSRFSNLFDISESATVELGGSYLQGPHGEHHHSGEIEEEHHEEMAKFFGADLTFKWRDVRKSYGKALIWQSDFLTDAEGEKDGFYSILQFKFARRFWISGGWSSVFDSGVNEYKTQLAFVPSEFSFVRLESVYTDDDQWKFFVQTNFTIGSHPAHKY